MQITVHRGVQEALEGLTRFRQTFEPALFRLSNKKTGTGIKGNTDAERRAISK